jgi:transposase-like protein
VWVKRYVAASRAQHCFRAPLIDRSTSNGPTVTVVHETTWQSTGPRSTAAARRRLVDHGVPVAHVARTIGCSHSSVIRWRGVARRGDRVRPARLEPQAGARLSAEARGAQKTTDSEAPAPRRLRMGLSH